RTHGRPALEAVEVAPGAHHRLLDGVVGLEGRAEHPVAVASQLPAVLLEVLEGDLTGGLRSSRHGRGVYGDGHPRRTSRGAKTHRCPRSRAAPRRSASHEASPTA